MDSGTGCCVPPKEAVVYCKLAFISEQGRDRVAACIFPSTNLAMWYVFDPSLFTLVPPCTGIHQISSTSHTEGV